MSDSHTTIYHNALPLQSMLLEYRLEAVLGAGGFGITYLARDTHLDKLVAIKEYLPGDLAVRALDGSIVPVNTEHEHNYKWGLERFIQEARTLAKFGHPHIVRVNRYFEGNGTGYMVMDYESGRSLSTLFKQQPQPEQSTLTRILMPLLDGLEAVHRAGFLHRDIKPGNVFIRDDGTPVLLDFGAARLATGTTTRTLTAVLTPGFAPLEQYTTDGHQGPWSDIYALAGVMFRAIANQNPPDAVSRMKADSVPAALAAARPRFDRAFLQAVGAGLAIDETRRPQSVGAWREMFRGAGLPTAAAAAPLAAAAAAATRTVVASTARPKRRWMVAASIALVALIAAAAFKGRSGDSAAGKAGAQLPAASSTGGGAAALPPDARQQIEELFRIGDTDGDGMLSRDELAAALPRLAREFERMDADSDGHLTRGELETAWRRKAAAPAGGIAKTENLPSGRQAPSLPPATAGGDIPDRVASEFERADTNHDGYLSPDEVRGRFPFIEKRFDAVDTDRDGRISLPEFAQLRRLQAERNRLSGAAPRALE